MTFAWFAGFFIFYSWNIVKLSLKTSYLNLDLIQCSEDCNSSHEVELNNF